MGNRFREIAAIVLFSMGVHVSANAALIGVVDHGDYFTDSINSLDWLDVSLSVNRSVDDVSSQFGAGGDFAGWRYATSAELASMVSSTLGITISTIRPSTIQPGWLHRGQESEIDELITLLGGPTQQVDYGSGYIRDDIYGVVADRQFRFSGRDDGWMGQISTWSSSTADVSMQDKEISVWSPRETFSAQPNTGSFLVRDAVPVPAPVTLFLMVAGLIGIGFLRRYPRN